MDQGFHLPKQDRSAKTLDRLLSATVKVLVAEGLDGAIIPRIATVAEVAPASVYRRFRDKESLLRAAFVRMLETSRDNARRFFNPEDFQERSFEQAIACIVHATMSQYRLVPKLVLAMKRFSDSHPSEEFDKITAEIFESNLRLMIECLQACPDTPRHQDFEANAMLGLLTVISAMEVRALEPNSLWSTLKARSDKDIETELTAMLMAYLRQRSTC